MRSTLNFVEGKHLPIDFEWVSCFHRLERSIHPSRHCRRKEIIMTTTTTLGLHNLVAPRNARKKKKRLGRGRASGHGKTAGRGHKGQKKTKSGNVKPGFEGGQLTLARRLPKVGFKNHDFRKHFATVNVGHLSERFAAGSVVDAAALVAVGLVSKTGAKVKILGNGDVAHKLTLKVHAISAGAKAKIEGKGGSVEVLDHAAVSA
jgi:large subunit ribosomal protein L15